MTVLDYILVVIYCASGFLGFRAGLFKKIFGIVSFFVGLIFGTRLMSPLGRVLHQSFGFAIELSYVLAFFLVFAGVVLIQNIISKKIGDFNAGTVLLNRVGGTLLGLIQGALAASLFLLMLSVFDVPSDSVRRDSVLYKATLNIAPRLFDLCMGIIPESRIFYDELGRDLAKFKSH